MILYKDKLVQIARQAITHEADALKALANSIDESFSLSIQLLVQTKGRIIVSGIGKSGIIARKISSTLSSTGNSSYFVHPSEASHGDLGMIGHDDVMIILSNGGESLELFDLVNFAQNVKIPIIAIVGRLNSTLARSANVTLLLPNIPEVSHINAPTTSTTMMLALGDALAVSLIEHKSFSPDQYKTLHPGGRIGAQLLKVEDIMCVDAKLPKILPDTKMPEALIEMTIKSLGCVIVVDETDSILGLITDGDLRRHMSKDWINMTAKKVMSENPYVIDVGLKVIDALQIMNNKTITSLLVRKDNKLAGLLHLHDCLKIGLGIMNNNYDDS